MEQAKRIAISSLIYAALFSALYGWKVLGIEGAGNLVLGWCVLLLLIGLLMVVGALATTPKLPEDRKGLPVFISRLAFWSFAVLLLWFGHWWMFASCVTFAVGLNLYRFAAKREG